MTDPAGRELSVRAFVLGAVLSAILGAANAYLGLFAGMTVSASIPAAVISMGILRLVGGTLLENNLVQTAASAGESAAAGAIFTLPALILLGAWARFDPLISALLIGVGGTLGVLYTILLRRALVTSAALPFPEGTATAEVLRAGHAKVRDTDSQAAFRLLVLGSLGGALLKFVEAGLGWSKAVIEGAFSSPVGVFYFGSGVSPALFAVGAIVGVEVGLVVFVGGAINWLLVVPFATDQAAADPLAAAWAAWSQKTRYLGVGAMTVGGIVALYDVRASIVMALRGALAAIRPSGNDPITVTGEGSSDRDLPPRVLLLGILGAALVTFFVFQSLTGTIGISLLLVAVVLVFGFLFSSVAAYMAGLLGSSNNPVSGVTIATILFTSLLLSGMGVSAQSSTVLAAAGPALAILVGSVVCAAAAIGGDNVQDLRAGHLLGARPSRQQVMQLVGVFVAALVLAPVLQLLLDAYGFGAPTAEKPHPLRAPQATLMASVARGVFGGQLPWPFLFAGVALGLLTFLVDRFLLMRGARFRVPVLALALGLYLPWELSGPILLGGIVSHVAKRRGATDGAMRSGLLAAAGLITGEALMGILLAALVGGVGSLTFLQGEERLDSPLVSLVLGLATLAFLVKAHASPRSTENPDG